MPRNRAVEKTQERKLAVALNVPGLVEKIVDCISRGVYKGMEIQSESVFSLPQGLGLQTYYYSIRYLSEALDPFGFKRDDRNSQVRFLSPEVKGRLRMRVVICSAIVEGGTAFVNEKGTTTKELIAENAPHNPQPCLFQLNDSKPLETTNINLWIFHKVDGKLQLRITLALVGVLAGDNDEMVLWDQELLAIVDMKSFEVRKPTLAESVPNPFVLHDQPDIAGIAG